MAKEKHEPFYVAMGAYDVAEVCKTVGLFVINNIANKFDKNSLSFYIETMNLPCSKVSMVIVQIKCVNNSANYLRKPDYLQKLNAACKLFINYFRLEHWH